MQMTPEQRTAYDAFLARLRETPRDWRLVKELIRREHVDVERCSFECCPLSACDPYGPAPDQDALVSALEMEIDEFLADHIMFAADNVTGHDPAIRADLLRACGLSE